MRARDAIYFALADVLEPETELSRDAGLFNPRPLGVLVGLPALVGRTLSGRTYSVAVHVISADPLNRLEALERLYALADVIVLVLGATAYQPTDWQGAVNADPLPAVLLQAIVTVTEEG
jgi:hypothetical protein